jgi:hypothetical protein
VDLYLETLMIRTFYHFHVMRAGRELEESGCLSRLLLTVDQHG